jgi:glyoxylase-like metal-dependent hydrolase (beta-lactamase superfamily II)
MQVTPHIHAIRLPFTIEPAPGIILERFVNVYLITGKSLTLIDTGVLGCEKQIFGYIRSIGRDPSEITGVLLTHSHPDHIGAARAIHGETGCCIAAHAAEKPWIEDVNIQCRERPVPGFHSLVGGSVPVSRVLEDGEILAPEGIHDLDILVLHTPGHSAGSLSFLLKSEGVLFTGDALPVPGGLPVYDDVLASVSSIKRLLKTDGIRALLSSWDEPRNDILAYQRMREAIEYLQLVHTTVLGVAAEIPADTAEFSRRVLSLLHLPGQAATPLLLRTLSAHVRLCHRPRLLDDEDETCVPPQPVPDRSGSRKLLN